MKLFSRIIFIICLILAILIGCEITESDELLNQGIALLEEGEYDRAIADFNKAIELNPKSAKVYNNRGIAYAYKGQHDKAISDFNKAIEMDPRNAWAYKNRGWVYHNKGQYDKAISNYSKAIEMDPRDAWTYKNRGAVYKEKVQYDKAIADFTKVIEINPKIADDYNNRGFVYYLKEQYDKACSDWRRACELGSCKQYDLAKKNGCENTEEIKETDPFVLVYRCIALRKKGQYANDVVRDTRTGLEWIAGPDRNTNWNDAKSWVEYLNVDGGGWRMPTINELEILYQRGVGTRNITPLLKTTGWWLWSGQTTGSTHAYAFTIGTGAKRRNYLDRKFNYRCFAVRSRK